MNIFRAKLPSRQSCSSRFALICLAAIFASAGLAAQQDVRGGGTPSPGDVTANGLLPDALPNRNANVARATNDLALRDRFGIYTRAFVKPDSVLGPMFGAAVNQARNEPPEWGQGAQGFGVRFASGYGRMLISRTIRFGVAAADHEDPRFIPSGEMGFWRRLTSATVHVFVVPTDRGTELPAFSRLAGIYGAAFISNAWYPLSRANTSHAFARGSTALSATVGWNVLREFWPDIKRHITP
jgi:hypothetical protein